jgi:type I restriction enzyme S subunit
MTEGGDWDKLGRCAVWSGEIADCIHQNHIFCVRADLTRLLPAYLAAYIGSPVGKAYFQSCAKQTTNLASINQRQLRAFPVVVPPLDVQSDFVAKLSRVRSEVTELRRMQAKVRACIDALLPAILDRAYADAL